MSEIHLKMPEVISKAFRYMSWSLENEPLKMLWYQFNKPCVKITLFKTKVVSSLDCTFPHPSHRTGKTFVCVEAACHPWKCRMNPVEEKQMSTFNSRYHLICAMTSWLFHKVMWWAAISTSLLEELRQPLSLMKWFDSLIMPPFLLLCSTLYKSPNTLPWIKNRLKPFNALTPITLPHALSFSDLQLVCDWNWIATAARSLLGWKIQHTGWLGTWKKQQMLSVYLGKATNRGGLGQSNHCAHMTPS